MLAIRSYRQGSGHLQEKRIAADSGGRHDARRSDISDETKRLSMLNLALLFFVVAIIAALFGFGGIATGAAEIAQVLFFVFLVLFLVSLIAGFNRRGRL
jgi:uncharacterized membrane protein YtjA (UPF0391 family)